MRQITWTVSLLVALTIPAHTSTDQHTPAAGHAGAGPLHEAPEDEWPSMLQANLQTAYALCRAALPHLRRQGGALVTIASRQVETGVSPGESIIVDAPAELQDDATVEVAP